jgi:hypothetical protein
MNERAFSERLFIIRWRASDELNLMAHSRREDHLVPVQEKLISRIKPNALLHLCPDTVNNLL